MLTSRWGHECNCSAQKANVMHLAKLNGNRLEAEGGRNAGPQKDPQQPENKDQRECA